MIYVSSDSHLNHGNIVRYTSRPFDSLVYMNTELIRRWNEVVTPEDTVIHLGDFCFNKKDTKHKDWERQLNGKIIFIQGNHDSHTDAPIQSLIFKYGGIDWWCSHYPEYRYTYNLCGHVHNLWRTKRVGKSVVVNCGVDVWNYTPVPMNVIMETARKAPVGESL